jgi:hypothetical protein
MSGLWWDHNSIIVLASLTHLELHVHYLGTVARLDLFTKRAYIHKTAWELAIAIKYRSLRNVDSQELHVGFPSTLIERELFCGVSHFHHRRCLRALRSYEDPGPVVIEQHPRQTLFFRKRSFSLPPLGFH